MDPDRNDLTRATLAVLSIVGLMGASFWILRPFLPSIVWATMIVVATWPLMRRVERRLWGKRWLAVATMTLALLLVLVIPFVAAIGTVLSNVDEITAWARAAQDLEIPQAPAWLAGLPLVGQKASAAWNAIAVRGVEELAREVAPYADDLMHWLVAEAGSFGGLILQFLLTVIVSAIFYANGESAAERVRRFARRLSGDRGDQVVRLAGQAIRGVALGVVVTALVQSVLGGLGLFVAGVPFASVLTAVMFMFAIAQIGPLPVMATCVAWVFWSGHTTWGVALLVWTLLVGALDNVLRPILIRRGADLPLLLIFAGVIGGLIAFGLIGIFVGPMLLAVTHTLVEAWVDEGEVAPPPAAAPPAA
jgi:predicted PurR-regulated permease PerM